MTPEQFSKIREDLGLTQEEMGMRLGGYSWRTVASWESGERGIPPAVGKLIKTEEEKAMLWAIIEDLERWMHGEGCFISERVKIKIDIARNLMPTTKADMDKNRALLAHLYAQAKKMKGDGRRKAKQMCSEQDCKDLSLAKGMCARHYQKQRRERA